MLRTSEGLLVKLMPVRGSQGSKHTTTVLPMGNTSGNLGIYLIFKRLLVKRQQALEQGDRGFSDRVP
jgi:hypothetical protein